MKKIHIFVLFVLVSVLLSACGKEQRGSSLLASAALVFEEVHPENQGRFAAKGIEWRKWTWHQDLRAGDVLVEGKHYIFDAALLPKGLSLVVEVTGQRSGIVSLRGQAQNHHVNDSVTGLSLEFQPEAFLSASRNALADEMHTRSVQILFGRGFVLSGDVQGATGTAVLREMDQDQTVEIAATDKAFRFQGRYESNEPYMIQIEKHPEGQCCRLLAAEGAIGNTDVDNLLLTCDAPLWQHPSDDNDIFFANDFSHASLSLALDTNFDHNTYGDFALGYSDLTQGTGNNGLFVSSFNQNTQTWTHPGSNRAGDDLQFLLQDPNGVINMTGDFRGVQISDRKDLSILHQQGVDSTNRREMFHTVYKDRQWHRPKDLFDFETDARMVYTGAEKHFSDGSMVRAWLGNGNTTVHYQRFAGGAWGKVMEIGPAPASGFASAYDELNIFLNARGDGIITWNNTVAGASPVVLSYDLYKAEIKNLQVVKSPTDELDTVNANHTTIGSVKYKHNAKGDVLMAFIEETSTGNYRLKVGGYFNGAWTSPTQVNPASNQTGIADVGFYALALNASGDAVIAWMQGKVGDGYVDLYAKVRMDNVWLNHELIKSATTTRPGLLPLYDDFFFDNITVAIDLSGRAYVGMLAATGYPYFSGGPVRDYDIDLATRTGTNNWQVEELYSDETSARIFDLHVHDGQVAYFFAKNNVFYQEVKALASGAWGSKTNLLQNFAGVAADQVRWIGSYRSPQRGLTTAFWSVNRSTATVYGQKVYMSQYR